jgi:dUTP pyrophosphatase
MPIRATTGSAGYDLWLPDVPPSVLNTEFCISEQKLIADDANGINLPKDSLLIPPYPVVIRLGFKIWIEDPGFEAQIRLRSSVGKKGIIIPNAPGTIDSDYQGEIAIMLMSGTGKFEALEPRSRVAQMVFCPVAHPEFQEVCVFTDKTNRGEGGFGSTGG